MDTAEYFANFVVDNMMKGLAHNIKATQTLKFGTDPTHTQIAKDALDHPLNPLAGFLAFEAVKDISGRMKEHWKNPSSVSIDSIIERLDTVYFVHPKDTTWMDEFIQSWAFENIKKVEEAINIQFKTDHHHHQFPTGYLTGNELDAKMKITRSR